MGDFNADPDEPAPRGCARPGFRSAYEEANGAEPAVTWPSGLQAPAMDTDGEPECLDYIWVRGAAAGRVGAARVRPSRPRGSRRSTRATTSGSRPGSRSGRGRCPAGPCAWPTEATGARRRRTASPPSSPRSRSRRATASNSTSGSSADGVPVVIHDATLDARARPARTGRRAVRGGARGARAPDARGRPGRGRAADVPRRRAQGRPRAGHRRGAGRRPEDPACRTRSSRRSSRRCSSGSRASLRAGRAGSSRDASTPSTIADARRARRSRRGGRVAGARRGFDRARPGGRSRGRGLDRPSPTDVRPPGQARRRRRLRRGRRARRLSRIRHRRERERRVGGSGGSRGHRGRDGRWLGVGLRSCRRDRSGRRRRARAGRDGRLVAGGRHRPGAGRDPGTVALGRWSIDFYNGQQAAYGTDSGFRELGYLILAVTDEDERAGRERVAMQRANGLDVSWLDAARPRDGGHAVAGRSSRQLRRGRRRDRSAAERARLLAGDAGGRRRAARTDRLHRAAHGAEARRRPRVVAVETDAGTIETDRVLLTGGPSCARSGGSRACASRPARRVTRSRPRAARGLRGRAMPMVFDIGAGLYWRLEEGGLLFGWSNPDETPARRARSTGRSTSACGRDWPRSCR